MPDTFTANYNWTKPSFGADSGSWGGLLNSDLDAIDAAVFAVAGAALQKSGGTLTGALTFMAGGTGSAPAYFQAGVLLSSPVAHALEWDGASLHVTQASGPSRQTLAYLTSSITGGAAKFSTARTLSITGDLAW